jgi:hypothetical protein
MIKIIISTFKIIFFMSLGGIFTLIIQYFITPDSIIVKAKNDFELFDYKGVKIAEIKKGAEFIHIEADKNFDTMALYVNYQEPENTFEYIKTNKKFLIKPYWKKPKIEEQDN